MEYKDYYKILGVSRDASQDEIKRAYRKLARKYHPDINQEKDAENQFKTVSEAYEVLKDPDKRQKYDQLGANWQAGQDFRPPPGWQSSSGGGGDFSDFFSTLFGNFGGARGDFQGGFGGMQGQDQQARIRVSLEDAFHGTTRRITLQVPEYNAQGQAVSHNRTINVKIPAGITAGKSIRLKGQGSPGMGGGPAGDLLLEVAFEPHPFLVPDGRNLQLELPITPWEAALGGQVSVPTLGGKVDMKIPAGARSGQKLRLKGRGLPGSPAGDQYIILQIVVPAPKNETQRKLYEQMAAEMDFDPRSRLMPG